MQPIKDYIVLDFLAWLRRKENEYLFIDRLEYDLKYKNKIKGYAKIYLSNINKKISGEKLIHTQAKLKTILKSFIDSQEFDRFFGYRYMDYGEDIEKSMSRFCKKLIHSSESHLENALLCYYWKVFSYNKRELDEEYLIESIKVYYRDFDDFRGKRYCKSEIKIIEQFLNYLDEKNVRLNIKSIPRNYLSRLVHRYNNTELKDEIIVDILKERINQKMFTALKRELSDEKLLRYKEMGYLYDRYNNSNVQFKCLILPLKGEINLEMFITKYWDDLDAASKNYLDIFISKNDVQLSGYETIEKITNLVSLEKIELPSILIWNEQMVDAKAINIRGLDFSQLYSCLQMIINLIKYGRDINDIINTLNAFVIECVEKNKQYIIIQQQINDNHGIIIGMQTDEVDLEYLYLSEIQMAMNELELLNLDSTLKKRSIGILHNLKGALRKKDVTELLICKEKYNKYIVGDNAKLVVDILNKYFYIRQCLGIDEEKGKDTYEKK